MAKALLTKRCLSSLHSSSVGAAGLQPCIVHRYFSTICIVTHHEASFTAGCMRGTQLLIWLAQLCK